VFVRFKQNNKKLVGKLKELITYLQTLKASENPEVEQSVIWTMIPSVRRPYFIWSADKLTKEQAKVELPAVGYYDEKWNVDELFDDLLAGDYKIDGFVELNQLDAEIRVSEAGDAYDGIDPLMDLVMAFGLELIGYNDFGDFIEVSMS
jgi:hypothetical protein